MNSNVVYLRKRNEAAEKQLERLARIVHAFATGSLWSALKLRKQMRAEIHAARDARLAKEAEAKK